MRSLCGRTGCLGVNEKRSCYQRLSREPALGSAPAPPVTVPVAPESVSPDVRPPALVPNKGLSVICGVPAACGGCGASGSSVFPKAPPRSGIPMVAPIPTPLALLAGWSYLGVTGASINHCVEGAGAALTDGGMGAGTGELATGMSSLGVATSCRRSAVPET